MTREARESAGWRMAAWPRVRAAWRAWTVCMHCSRTSGSCVAGRLYSDDSERSMMPPDARPAHGRRRVCMMSVYS